MSHITGRHSAALVAFYSSMFSRDALQLAFEEGNGVQLRREAAPFFQPSSFLQSLLAFVVGGSPHVSKRHERRSSRGCRKFQGSPLGGGRAISQAGHFENSFATGARFSRGRALAPHEAHQGPRGASEAKSADGGMGFPPWGFLVSGGASVLLSEIVEGSMAVGEHTGCRVGVLQRVPCPSTSRFICEGHSSRLG